MEKCLHVHCKKFTRKFTFQHLIRCLSLSYLLIFGLSTTFAAKTGFYDNKEKVELQEQTSSDFSLFKYGKSEPQTDSSFDLYGADPLKAPPGGGEPIGGVTPVGDGIWILCLLAAGYICFRYRRTLRNEL